MKIVPANPVKSVKPRKPVKPLKPVISRLTNIPQQVHYVVLPPCFLLTNFCATSHPSSKLSQTGMDWEQVSSNGKK